jgi:hypothetical protein
MNVERPAPDAERPAPDGERAPSDAPVATPTPARRPAPPFDARGYVESLPARPGVYRMLDAQGEILYVGKARNLKSRVGSYFQPSNVHPKVQALVAKTAVWCCATTRASPTCISRRSMNFRA